MQALSHVELEKFQRGSRVVHARFDGVNTRWRERHQVAIVAPLVTGCKIALLEYSEPPFGHADRPARAPACFPSKQPLTRGIRYEEDEQKSPSGFTEHLFW